MLLTLEEVTKRFGGLTAVNGVSFDIAPGEMVAVVGPNGAGKTSLFNCIAGATVPDEGRITFDGVDITRAPPHQRAAMGLARTFQIPRPFAGASVRENVAIGAMFGSHAQRASVDGAMARADRYLELFGLAQHRDKPAASLTPIENKLLGMARALATQPKLLLLDESMAGMNPREIDGMIALLRRVRDEEHIAVVGLVEHIMRAVVGLAERVIVMHQGAVLVDEPTQTALSDPRVIDVYLGTSSHR
jgi:branched-chain amino acid transport system ATP-binding protein